MEQFVNLLIKKKKKTKVWGFSAVSTILQSSNERDYLACEHFGDLGAVVFFVGWGGGGGIG